MQPQYTTADELELAYLAGAIDADGYISIRSKLHSTTYPEFNETIGLGQLSPLVPKLLQARFGGPVQVRTRREAEAANWRPLYCWIAQCRLAASACAALLPYLRIKADQAGVVLRLRASKDRPNAETHIRIVPRGHRLSDETVAYRQALCDEIRALNRTGRAP